MNFIRSQLIEIIEWLDESNQTLVWRFPDEDHEIKNGAQLICRPSQAAVFVREGQIADVFGPGLHDLTTSNLPVLTKIANWRHGFDSPFKAEVYFINLKRYIDQRWGTSSPVLIRDPNFARAGRPGAVRLRAYGTYSFRIVDPAAFFVEIVSTRGLLEAEDIDPYLRSRLVSAFSAAAGKSEVSVLDMAAHYGVLAEAVSDGIDQAFGKMGLLLTSFIVENVSLPPEVSKAIDSAAALAAHGVEDSLAWEGAQALRDAARNPSGTVASMMNAGLGLGAGVGIGQAMGGMFTPQRGGAARASAPGPTPPRTGAGSSASELTAKLTALKSAFEAELITSEEYAAKKRDLLAML
ncbi:MAG: hypothetical protein B7733_20420 [Myxococcales bacterium FL481]|nr:MAG: hypothetical protein B7733_20420 [Myxococcales bacterium FL481]